MKKTKTIKKITILLLAAVLLLSLASCAKKQPTSGFVSYDSPGNYYSLEYPESWIVTRDDGMFAIKSSTDDTNISVTIFDLGKETVTIDEYIDGDGENEGYLSMLEKTFASADIISDTHLTVAGFDARRIVYTANVGPDEFKFDVTIFIVSGTYDSLYTVTFTSTVENYDTHIATLEGLLGAMKVN